MIQLDIEATRTQIRAMDFVRGTPEEVASWRLDGKSSRINIEIEGMTFTLNEAALFELLLEEAVPPTIVPRIVLRLSDVPPLHDVPGVCAVALEHHEALNTITPIAVTR